MLLEERVLLAAQPVVSVDSVTVPIGNSATINLSFDNVPDGSPGGQVGYAPYVDLVLPLNGADGGGVGSLPPNENDGVSFVSASYLGVPLSAQIIEFDASGLATHPFARDATGALRVVSAADYGAAAGDQLVVLQLPFGSFVPEQPAAQIAVTIQLSPFADLDTTLPVAAVGGFAFGRDALNNPTVDPPVLGAIATGTVTPTLVELGKTFDGPESETATGPNFPRNYAISFDLASGQQVTNAVIRDVLPDGIVVNGPIQLLGVPGSAIYDPLTHTVTATLDGTVTGIAGPEARIIVPFYVGRDLAPGSPGTPVLDPAGGGPRTITNDVTASLDWVPLDPRDPPRSLVIDPPGPEAEFTARSLATQKSQAIAIDVGAPGLGPGDTLRYTIEVQVSDYFDFRDLRLDDLLSDGQEYIAGSARLHVVEAGSTAGSGLFAAPFLSVTPNAATGTTAFDFDVSGQLVANGADGVLIGGEGVGATTFRITYDAVVERFFADGTAIGQGDRLGNQAGVAGSVQDDAGVPTGGRPDDGTASSGVIATGGTTKEIYALNGTILAPGTPVRISSGDLVTFRLTYALPQTLASELRLTDYLPLPAFDVDGFTLSLLNEVSAAVPDVNVMKWGPDAGGFASLLTTIPLLAKDSAANSLTLTFTDLAPAVPTATTADVLFTLRVADRPFGDGLLLTNQVLGEEFNARDELTASSVAIRQLTLSEPNLTVTKGVIAVDNGSNPAFAPVFTQDPNGPVAFTAPGSPGVRFAGVLDTTALAATAVNSDLRNVDAGARVSFAIVLENRGTGRDGAFDVAITDTLPSGFRLPPGGLNLTVTDGAGNAIGFTGDLFAGGIELDDQMGRGALAAAAPGGGANVVVITYDLEITEAVEARGQLTNTAAIANYAAFEGGVDRVPNTQLPTSDIATVAVGEPTFEKTPLRTDVAATGSDRGDPALFDLTIGESITFELVATLREGRIRGFEITDTLPAGLQFVRVESVAIGSNLFVRNPDGSTGAALPDPLVTASASGVRFDFADDIVNLADNILNDEDRIRIEVTAVLTNDPLNQPGRLLTNTGTLAFLDGGQTVSISDTGQAEVVGPDMRYAKTADRALVQGGEIVTYTVDVSALLSGFGGPAFDVRLTDILIPGNVTLVAGSLSLVVTPAGGATLAEQPGGSILVEAPVLLAGETIRFTYQGLVANDVVAGSVLTNAVDGRVDSFPGTQPDGFEREQTGRAEASVRVPGPGIVKTVSVADTSLPETGSDRFVVTRPDLAIGEIVTYRIVVTFPEAVSRDVVFTDFLPGAIALPPGSTGTFEYLDAGFAIGADLSAPGASAVPILLDSNSDGTIDTVRFTFGDVTNLVNGVLDAGDEIRIFVTARVLDAPANLAGTAPRNTAEVDFGLGTQRATADVDIVEPNVAIDKTSSRSSGDAGDRVAFTIRLPNATPNAGPAFDVQLADTIPLGFTIDAATLRFVGAALAGATLGYDAATRTVNATLPTYLPSDAEVVIAYDALVDPLVFPDQELRNLAAVRFDSHPGTPPDRFQRDYGPVEDSTVFTVDRPSIAKTVSATDIAETGFAQFDPALRDVAVGETITYLITFRMPEATSDIVITDRLPGPLGVPPNQGDLEYLTSRVVSLGDRLSFVSGAPVVGQAGDAQDTNGDGLVDRVVWDFGRVTNTPETDPPGGAPTAGDLIVLEVTARVRDVAANQPGNLLVNLAEGQYSRATGAPGTVSQAETVELVGPQLVVSKSALPASGDAGDEVLYTIVVSHDAASSAWAYGLDLDDLLAPGLALLPGTVTVSNPAAVVASGNGASDATIRVTLGALAGPVASLGVAGETLTITYRAALTDAVRAGQVIDNTADLDWRSSPVGFAVARPGAASDQASAAVVFPSALEKRIVATSLDETGQGFFDPTRPDVAAGETITYELRVTLGEGTQRVFVQDTLPAGLVFVRGEVLSLNPAITGSLLGAGDVATIAPGGAVVFDFGNNLVNPGDNDPSNDVILLQVVARVAPGQAAGTVLTNDARFTTDTGTLTDTASADVVRADPLLTKTASAPTGDAGDEITFTVVMAQRPGATGPLFGLDVTDALPLGYLLVAGSAQASRGAVSESGNSVRLQLSDALLPVDDPATPGAENSVTLTYRARLADAVQPGQVLTNIASFSGNSAPGLPPAQTDAFSGQDDATLRVAMPVTLVKAIVGSSLPETTDPNLAVGETVTYRLTATLSQGTQTLVITDTLPAGLEVLDARFAGAGTGLPASVAGVLPVISGQSVTFDFGTVTNRGDAPPGEGFVSVEIVARVRDLGGPVAGDTLTNAGSVTITSPDDPTRPGGSESATDDTTATVVEPRVVLEKQAAPGFRAPGETMLYTILVRHDGASGSAAYDLDIRDALADPFLDLVAGTVTTDRGTVLLGNAAGDATLRVVIPVLALGETATITFLARVADATPAGTTLENLAGVRYDSAAGPGGREGTSDDSTQTPGIPGLDKVIAGSDNPDTADPQLAIGETVTYRLTFTLPRGTAENVVLSDLLPAALQPLAGGTRVISTGSLATGAPVITVDPTGRSVSVAFGTVVNSSGAAIGPEDQIVIEVDARVQDVAGIGAGAVLPNNARADFTIGGRPGQITDVAPAELVEPRLEVTKTVVGTTSGDAGDSFTYRVTITHAAGSTAPAYDVRITDLLDPRLVALSVTPSTGSASITGNTITLDVARLLIGESVTLDYVVRMADTVEPGQTINNRADLRFDSNPGPGGREGTGDAGAPPLAVVFALDLEKTIIDTSLPETGTSAFSPLPDLALGELVTYRLVATLSEGTQRLVITDTLPDGFTPISGSVFSTGGLQAGAGGTLTPAALIVGREVSFDFGTLVNPGTDRTPPGSDDQVVVLVIARVDPNPALNLNGRVATNEAAAQASSPSAPGAPGGTLTDSASASAEIVVPDLGITKDVIGPVVGDAGDSFTYRVVVTPAGRDSGPAYNVVIEDDLPPLLLVADPSSLTTSAGSIALIGNTIRVTIPVLLADAAPVVISYSAVLTNAVTPGQVVPNTANLGYATAPSGGLDLAGSDSAEIRGEFSVLLDKQVIDTSLPETGNGFFDPARPDVAAGETVTYRLTATIQEGTQRLVFRDTLPAGLVPEAFLGFALEPGIVAGPPVVTISGQDVTIDFGVIVNPGNNVVGDRVSVDVLARRDASQPAGTALFNAASVTIAAPDGSNPSSAAASAGIDAVAAVLVFDKQAAPASVALGNTITYTLTLSHAGNSTAPAYEVLIEDPLSEAALQLVPGSVVASLGTVVTGNAPGERSIAVSLPVLLPGQVLTITFQALAVGVPIPDGNAVNTAAFGSNSAPGPLPPGFNLPASGRDSATVAIASGLVAADGGLLDAFDDAFRRIGRNALDAPAILVGTAQPGASVSLALRDANGAPITIVGLTADVGGHWVANPIATSAGRAQDDAAFAEAQMLAGRERAPSAPLPPGPAQTPPPTPQSAPYSVLAAESPAAFDQRAGMDGVRVTFGGTLQPGGAFLPAPESPGAFAAPLAANAAREQAGLSAPQSLAWNRFALDFARATAAASVAAR